ncbi:F-box protein Hrt3p [[Candida] jaroonii]|uniref:F-box protein Hrt3p n=1 Tax=[Candida] jaroonii TaxID=467808 RepID=A0ACA9Y8N5_9ASCO|nr:F-box protein Hrt3p [[Candida] jaroonii]
MEAQGLMSDAVTLYRQAFKLNERVDLLYRSNKIPQVKKITNPINEELVKKINVEKLILSFQDSEPTSPSLIDDNGEDEEGQLTQKFSKLMTGPSPLTKLSNDIWIYIMEILIEKSPESWISLSLVCKKFAYLGFSPSIFRHLATMIYPPQRYEENEELDYQLSTTDDDLPVPKNQLKILPSYNNSWKYMLFHRPFIKFNGCYISIINYYSEGSRAEFSNSWTNPVRTITYYRYLRFFPDGKVLKVLTTLEPTRVIPHLQRSNYVVSNILDQVKGNRDGHRIYHGRWIMNTDGEVHITIDEGSVPYYIFHYHFKIVNMGHNRFGKLSWIKYYTVRIQGEEEDIGEVSELGLKNEKPFKFSRVRSYE